MDRPEDALQYINLLRGYHHATFRILARQNNSWIILNFVQLHVEKNQESRRSEAMHY